ncbi:hypothetical protein ACWCV9_33495 [Streptomyces sp. NPDC001606]
MSKVIQPLRCHQPIVLRAMGSSRLTVSASISSARAAAGSARISGNAGSSIAATGKTGGFAPRRAGPVGAEAPRRGDAGPRGRGRLKDIQEMLGHSSIAITVDTYTSLLPEADLAIAEATARLVPRARRASDAEKPEAEREAADGGKSGTDETPADAEESAAQPGRGGASAHAPLTQSAPDAESEAE